jgi:hypothetical protein
MRWWMLLVLVGCDDSSMNLSFDLAGAPVRNDLAMASSSGASIWPLANGNSWTYDVTTFGSFPVCTGGSQTSNVTQEHTLDGKDAFTVRSFCPAAGSSDFYADGDRVYLYYQNAWIVALDSPVAEGHSWTEVNSSFTWHATTTSGYSDCWKAQQNVTYTAYSIYCRGVGMVRNYSQDLNGGGWDAQLTSKNF